MSMRLGQHVLNEGMIVYVDDVKTYLPLTETIQSLGLPIKVHGEDAYAEGWFREENNRFVLDLHKQLLVISGTEQAVDWQKVEWDEFEIYVESELLKQWLDLQFDVLLGSLLIRINTGQWLPLEQKIERRRSWERSGQQAVVQSESGPLFDNPSRVIGWPTLDNNLRFGLRGRGGELESQYQYDLLAAGELFWLNATYSANLGRMGNTPLAFSGRLQLDRPPVEGSRWQLSLGDLTTPSIALVTQQQEGLGFVLSSFNQQQSAEFDRIGLSGDALNGWDVEVYQNNQLVAFQTVNESNRYEFNELPVQFGLNLFRLVFHGPEGQRREELKEFLIGENMVPEGSSDWQFSANLTNRRLLPGQTMTVWRSIDDMPLLDDLQTAIGWRYGLSPRWSVHAGLSRVPNDEEGVNHYATLGVQTSFHELLFQLDQSVTNEGGRATRLTAQHLGEGNSWIGEYANFHHYASPLINSGLAQNAVEQRAQLSWTGRLGSQDPVSVQSRFEDYAGGRYELRHAIRYSHRYQQLNATTAVNHEYDSDERDRLNISQLMSYRKEGWELNAQLGYQVKPLRQLDSANITSVWRPSESLSLRANLRKAFGSSSNDSLNLNLSMAAKRLITSVAMNYNFASDFGVSVNFFTSLGREAQTWQAYARSHNATASLALRVFLDNNDNQRFDEGDEAIPGVRFRVQGGGKVSVSDELGRVHIGGLSTQAPVLVSLNESSLEDPYWVPVRSSYRLQLHPGQSQSLDFPLVQSAEVDGTAWIQLRGKEKPASNVQIQLVNNDGQIVKEVRTAYDGFYVIDRVIPGSYRLRLAAQQLERLNLIAQEEHEIELARNGDLQSGLDFHLVPTDAEE